MFLISEGIKHKPDIWFLEYLIRTFPLTCDYKVTIEKNYQNLRHPTPLQTFVKNREENVTICQRISMPKEKKKRNLINILSLDVVKLQLYTNYASIAKQLTIP